MASSSVELSVRRHDTFYHNMVVLGPGLGLVHINLDRAARTNVPSKSNGSGGGEILLSSSSSEPKNFLESAAPLAWGDSRTRKKLMAGASCIRNFCRKHTHVDGWNLKLMRQKPVLRIHERGRNTPSLSLTRR